ncbi:MAG: hypothetical protein R2688_04335 [Fimbriimonadaceae bacterium]
MTSESKEKVAKMSEACAGMEQNQKQALAAAYHARVLFGMGKKDAAMGMDHQQKLWLTNTSQKLSKRASRNSSLIRRNRSARKLRSLKHKNIPA